MFTSINAVLKQLNAEGWNDITLEYINKGVMTDTYKMHTKTKKYAVRCYPNPRRWLAEVEYSRDAQIYSLLLGEIILQIFKIEHSMDVPHSDL